MDRGPGSGARKLGCRRLTARADCTDHLDCRRATGAPLWVEADHAQDRRPAIDHAPDDQLPALPVARVARSRRTRWRHGGEEPALYLRQHATPGAAVAIRPALEVDAVPGDPQSALADVAA